MLKLNDFFHLPQLVPHVKQLVGGDRGLVVVAGLDPRPLSNPAAGGFLPSGRAAIFRILLHEMLAAHPNARAVVITEDRTAIRLADGLRRRVNISLVRPPDSYAGVITAALRRKPDLLVIDRLCESSTLAALEAALAGVRVLSQLDTVARGAGVARHLLDLGATVEQLRSLAWVIAVQRFATLCPYCKQPITPSAEQIERLRRYATGHSAAKESDTLWPPQDAGFFRAVGCPQCDNSGRQGEVASFDIFCPDHSAVDLFDQPSCLPLEEYLARLAALGHLPLDDALHPDADQLRRTQRLLNASERALSEANVTLERKLAELEAANRVLQQRTVALVSLQEIGQALISTTDLDDLVDRVCRYACDLCGADRAILYLIRPDGYAEVLAVRGWDRSLLHQQVDPDICSSATSADPTPFADWPPGITPRHPDVEGVELRAGLQAPLIAERQQVGIMIIHSTRKRRFTAGEVALLRAFATHAALSIQRATLIDQLRDKISLLEAAQAKLVAKERMERELELAREVQQSVLPRTFPLAPGYSFGACNKPARRVGGDMYDVFRLDNQRFGVVIADVSDKGMPAALYMALARSLLLAEARRDSSPRAVLLNVNRLLRELGDPHMFVTVFYGIVDRPSRCLTYARAGHDYPLLLRDGVAWQLGGQGIMLGFFDEQELRLSEEQLALAPGDRLVLYTDGLIDVLDPSDQRFDLERLQAILLSHATLGAAELCEATFDDLAAYQGSAEQYDDMTMLVVAVEF